MKVTVKFNNRREQFDGVETKTFQQFRDDVYTRFGIQASINHDFKMGVHVVSLEPNQSLSEFGVVSGDILFLIPNHSNTALGNMDNDANAAEPFASTSTSTLTNPPSSSQSNIASSETSTAVEMRDEVVPFSCDNLGGLCIETVESFFEKYGYESTGRIRLPEDDSMFLLLEYSHQYASTKLQLSMNMFRDDNASNKVTSLHLAGMIITISGERHLQQSMLLGRNTVDTREELTEMLVNSLLLPIKERMLGPDNAFLQFLGQGFPAAMFFRYLTAKDLVHIEETCRYAMWRCRSSRLIDEVIWKPLLGSDAPQKIEYPQTYREIYQKKIMEQRQLSEAPCLSFAYRPPFNPHFFVHDDWSARQFHEPEPFRPIPSPLDPFTGGLVLPERPNRQPGLPRIYPHRPGWEDLNRTDQPPDPDMPQGPQRNPFGRPGFGETDSEQPGFGFPRRGGNRPHGGNDNFPGWM